MSSLSLDSDVIRFLISAPSRFVGQLSTPDLSVQMIMPSGGVELETSIKPGPYSRSYYLVSIRVPDDPSSAEAFAVPVTTLRNQEPLYDFRKVGGMLCDLASVWFGKSFDYHGVIADHSIAYLPNLGSISPVSHHGLGPYNQHPRPDLEIKLKLQELEAVLVLLYKREPAAELNAFWSASRFYTSALRVFEYDPEVAFFNLIVALEIISSQIDVPDGELYDRQAQEDLEAVEDALGDALANRVRQRYFQLSRRMIYAAKTLVNDTFFEGCRASQKCYCLNRGNLESCVKAAYDLRSKYAHSGMPFGIWLDIVVMPGAEVQVGQPVLPDGYRRREKILANIPTFLGLERLVRFTVLRFAHLRISEMHNGLG